MPKTQTTFEVDGKGHIEINIEKDDNVTPNANLHILAVVEEELTGNKQNSTTKVSLHQFKETIKPINPPKTIRYGAQITYIIVVQNLDGSPVQDIKNPVMLSIGENEFQSVLDKNGMVTFNFTISKLATTRVFCTYKEQRQPLPDVTLDINPGIIQLVLNTNM